MTDTIIHITLASLGAVVAAAALLMVLYVLTTAGRISAAIVMLFPLSIIVAFRCSVAWNWWPDEINRALSRVDDFVTIFAFAVQLYLMWWSEREAPSVRIDTGRGDEYRVPIRADRRRSLRGRGDRHRTVVTPQDIRRVG
jgi:hypothetical protein